MNPASNADKPLVEIGDAVGRPAACTLAMAANGVVGYRALSQ